VKPPFERVVAEHGATVLRVCRAVLGPTDADDAWSETFLAALRAYPDLPADANVEAWLVTIAHRKAIDVTRAARRRPIPVPDPPETAASESAAPESAAPESAASDDGRDLIAAVAALPPKQRQAVAYHYLTGLPYAEIAGLLGGTAAAARRAAADGIAALRRTIGESR
jgi:RNA polymerase sigma factor (sigma-70 family)